MPQLSPARAISALAVPLVLGSAWLSRGQSTGESIFNAKLLQNRYGLSVRGAQFSGTGAQLLLSAIAQSRFVLVGEWHELAETPKFWQGVCSAAGPAGFHSMAVEEGPLIAAELQRWARQPDGQTRLAAFEKQFPDSLNIYNTIEEFEMLQRCSASAQGGAFRLWGVNQEGLGAAGLMLERILDTQPGRESEVAIRGLLEKNGDASARAMQTGKISDLYMISADDRDLAAAASVLQKDGTPQARSLFASLTRSHEINRAWPADAERRFRLMNTLFSADYAEAARSEPSPPKVLLKFGSFHLYRGLNPMHQSGLGNYVAEFAARHGAQSLHICLMPVKGSGFMFPGVGRRPTRLRPFNLNDDPRSRYLQPIFANLLAADWTLFDLRPLRKVIDQQSAMISSELATLISGMDILVMIPEATPSTRIH